MKNFKKLLSISFMVGALSACGLSANNEEETIVTPVIPAVNELRFTDKAPIELKVNGVDTVSEFTPTFKDPNVEHLFPISIEKSARNWARDRLKPVDFASDKKAIYTIKDASVVKTIEKSDKTFTQDREKYRATLKAVLKVIDPNKVSSAQTEVEAWRELTIPANTPVEEKEKYWEGMVVKLFNDFDIRMEQNINQYLNMYLKENKVVVEYK